MNLQNITIPTYFSNVILDEDDAVDEKEDKNKKRQKMVRKIDEFVEDKLNHDYISFSDNRNNIQHTFEDVDSSSESEDEEAKHLDFLESIIYQKSDVQISHLYWRLTKLLRYIRSGNVHATLLCLCYMNNNKLKSPECMRTMEDSDGAALLLNLLSANDMRCLFQQGYFIGGSSSTSNNGERDTVLLRTKIDGWELEFWTASSWARMSVINKSNFKVFPICFS